MITFLKKLCIKAIVNKKLTLHKQILTKNIKIHISKKENPGHFQFNGSVISKIIKQKIPYIANIIKKNIKNNDITITTSKNNFINFTLSNNFINQNLNIIKEKTYYQTKKKKKIIIDFSAPNVAKDMHVGHLRSTIIGECLSNILKHTGHKIIKINHLGDWGTQFGILINFLKKKYKDKKLNKVKITLKKLSNYYKTAQENFNNNIHFKNEAQKTVLELQKKKKHIINIWKQIIIISKKEYKKIYSLLKIKIIYKGESFYQNLLKPIVEKIKKKNMLKISKKAKCVYINGFKNKSGSPLPLIIQKSDGGYNYATTELATLYYRITYHMANEIIYLTDIGQTNHFKMVFNLINKSNLNKNKTKLTHIPLGLMLNPDGKKIRTRSGESKKLIDLLKTSIKITSKIINKKKNNIKNINKYAKIIGINTLKYSDLSNKLNRNYIFDQKKMLQYNGNTASFLMYAYVRINSIKKKFKKIKIKKIIKKHNVNIKKKAEINLSIHILQYKHIIQETVANLNPNILTTYLYKLSEKFHIFFHSCNVITSQYKYSRLIICDLTRKILKKGLRLLGLQVVTKM